MSIRQLCTIAKEKAMSQLQGVDTDTKPRTDVRGYFRKALAFAAPLPLLAMGINYLFLDIPETGDFNDMVAAVPENQTVLDIAHWTTPVFFAGLIPAVLAVALVSYRFAPRLTAVGATICMVGIPLGIAGPNDHVLAELTVDKQLDVETMKQLDEAWWAMPSVGLASLAFILAIVIGLLLLGLALARTGTVSKWFGYALAFGGFTHPFIPFHEAAGIGLIVGAIGFAGASIVLLRTPNDEFLPG